MANASLIPINEIDLSSLCNTWFTIHNDCKENLSNYERMSRTHPIEEYPCLVYLVEFRSHERIRVWLQEKEVQVEKCSDYISNTYAEDNMQPCWVCKWLDWNADWLIDTNVIDHASIVRPDFYRLIGDRSYEYGDGGHSFLVYPVWIHEDLSVNEKRRIHLLSVLDNLNEQRQDHHEDPSPVEDIIDPDLLAYRPSPFDQEKWTRWRLKQFNYHEPNNGDSQRGQPSSHQRLRDTYQWLPSDFVIRTDGTVDIRSSIHHLPCTKKYQQAYNDIAHIFQAMLPMFEQMKLVQRNTIEEQRLQVVVKAQSYNLKAGMKYSGRWHTEGHKENIIAAGVYYLYVDDELEGGTLKFRPKDAPNFRGYEEIQVDYEVTTISTGAAVVFSNAIPHRFRQIHNLTEHDGRHRTFLNFFIVDPDQPIVHPLNEVILAPIDSIFDILSQWSEGRMPDLVYRKFREILKNASAWETWDEAKEFRTLVRRAMLEEKSGWGYIDWGNCGTVEFLHALCLCSPYKRDEIHDRLHHTESD